MNILSQKGQYALTYAQRYDWEVFPVCWPNDQGTCACGSNHTDAKRVGKVPLVAHGLLDASVDPTEIYHWWTRWPEANIGMTTGRGSGVVVVDTDLDHGGTEKWADLLDINGPVHTLEVITGGGGRLFQGARHTPAQP